MMIDCPCCGKRYLSEFSYEGDATVVRPDTACSSAAQAWYRYVYARVNGKEKQAELWHHHLGCRQFVVLVRDLHNHRIHATYRYKTWQHTASEQLTDSTVEVAE